MSESAASSSFLVRGLVYAVVLLLDLAGGVAFGWHFALGGAAGAVTAFVWLWAEAR